MRRQCPPRIRFIASLISKSGEEQRLKSAQAGFDKLTAEGHVVIKANIDPGTFPLWRRDRGLKMNAQARMAFGNECAAEHCRSKMK
jgi:hypothetical protein